MAIPQIINPPESLADPLAQAVLNSLSAHIAILDENGVILETNRAWRAYADAGGAEDAVDFIGVNYLDICDATTGPDADNAHRAAEGIRSVIAGEAAEFLFDYPCHTPDGKHWYYMRVVPMATRGP
ncbi:MAG: PAS domain-containing protein, partial [Thermodesulfobacteriota bacterium]